MATSGGSAVATALNFGDGAKVNLHGCRIDVHAEKKGAECTPSGPQPVRRKDHATTGYVQISDNIFMDNRKPLRKDSRVFRGFQQHVGGRRQPLAIKVICPCEERHVREVQHLVKLAPHPNVVQIIHSNKDMTKAPQLYITMELCSQQNFRDRMKKNVRFNFNETMSFTRQLLAGMQHIHDNGVIHRDVKPENLLLSEDETLLKVTDFGLSKELEPNQSVTNISTLGQGTNAYRAPETHNSDIISKSADIFCLGITMFEFFSNGKHPFGDDTTLRDHNIKNNKGHDYSGLLITGTKKEEFLDLIKRMLNKDPKKRPTINEVIQHQFFSTLPAPKRAGPITVAAVVNDRFSINVESLERFLKQDELKGRPLVVISVNGDVRSGKSFIMNFFIRYLRKKGWKNSNWFGDADDEVEDGFEWMSGSMQCTKGINIWSEIFDVPLHDGRKAAVLLMVTRGFSGDHISIGTDLDTLLTSSLFSSHIVLNVTCQMEPLNLERLMMLLQIERISRFITRRADQTTPFQTLSFLVRDWKRDFEFEFGDSTHKYLAEFFGWLSMFMDVQNLKSLLPAAFSDVKCFLLPHPGERVMRPYGKNLRNKDLDEDFREFTKELVETVLHPRNIVVKRNREGDEATADDLLQMIKQFNKIF